MDSLLTNYASSDEEEEQQQQRHAFPSKLIEPSSSSKVSSLFSSLPQSRSLSLFSSIPQPKQTPKTPIHEDKENSLKPTYATKSSSLFSSLPQPTQTAQNPKIPINDNNKQENSKPSSKPNSSSIFSSVPQPKSENPQQQAISKVSSLDQTPKRIVQFKPPINLPPVKSNNFNDDEDEDEDDEDDEEKERKRRKQSEFSAQNSSVKSFLSNIPAPKNSATLGVLPSLGSGRRSIIETETPESNPASFRADNESGIDQNAGNYANYESSDNQNAENYVRYEPGRDQNAVNYGTGIDQYSANYANYGGYDQNMGVSGDASSYGSYESYGDQYGNNRGDSSATMTVPEAVGVVQSVVRVPGKRGKNEIPKEIVEVKQDELMKNRPREDQVKLTGIAFGPSYQPASTKGKPTKLHKRKHQITSLYYDMKQKEMELVERRSRGILTKAETQAKYGW